LSRSGFFSTEQYLNEISIRFQKHMNNFGRFNYSVAQSSFDTWLDGYVTGVPNRKTSIYDEGSLIAVMLDFLIRKSTANKKSLDDVMRNLFFDFAKKEKGYSENDFKKVCEEIAARSFDDFFANYIHAPVSYENLLLEVFEFAGLEVVTTDSQKIYESHLGFTLDANAPAPIVLSIAPGSPAEVAGLTRGDEIISINNYKAAVDFEKWMQHFAGEEITLDVFTANHERVLKMRKGEKTYFSNYAVKLKRNLTDEQKEFFGMWTGKVLSKSKSL
jgi:predicted metalloprotease with PDZ domain